MYGSLQCVRVLFVTHFCLGVPSICLFCVKPFSVGSHGLLVCVLSLSVIFCLMCSSKSLYVLCILRFGMCCLSVCIIIVE